MSKKDRYAHLGNETDGETPAERPADADLDDRDSDDRDSEIRITIDDGDGRTTLTVDSDAASVDELRDAVRAASDDTSPAPLAAGVRSMLATQRLALNAGITGAVVMEQAASAPFVYKPR